MIVGFIVYDYIKELQSYRENYFFKIFEVSLLDFDFPESSEYLPEKFLTSWVKLHRSKDKILE